MRPKSSLAVLVVSCCNIAGAAVFPPIQFQAGFGGTGYEEFRAFVATDDGGALLGGSSSSPISGNKTAPYYADPSVPRNDYWIVKMDSLGTKQWDKSFGGGDTDTLGAILSTGDGGFLLGGSSDSFTNGIKTSPVPGFWTVRLDANGNRVWDQTYSARNAAGAHSLRAMSRAADGGFFLVGSVALESSSDPRPVTDFWVVRTDAQGNKLWDRKYGGTNFDSGECIVQTSDGGFLIGGSSQSGGGGSKTAPSFGRWDFWIAKIDGSGNQQWDRSYGGQEDETLSRILPTADGGFLLAGSTSSGPSGNKTSVNFGSDDFWLVKIDANGNKLWEVEQGGDRSDLLNDIAATVDGGYLIGGTSQSIPSGTKSAPYYSNPLDPSSFDYWIVKVDPAGHKEWDQSYGGTANDYLGALLPTGRGDILIGGLSVSGTNSIKTTSSYGGADWWVLKLSGTNPPSFVAQPRGGPFTSGESVALSVDVDSFTMPTFQWYRNGELIAAETNASLALLAMQPANAGNYTCVVSNFFGAVESEVASLTYTEAASLELTLNPLLTIFGAPGRTYRIESTLDPTVPSSWTSITNVTLSQSPQQWVDPRPAAQTNRFYRAILTSP